MTPSTNAKSLQWQIFVRIAPVAILALLAVIAVSGFRVSQTLHQEIQSRVDASAIHAGHQTEMRVDVVVEASNAVAQNDIVVNGIVDLEHRNTTLQSYFRSLKLPGPDSQIVTMTDYKGRVLASTTPGVSDFGAAVWFSRVMSGKRFVGMADRMLTVAVPVLYSNRAEGVVVSTFAIDDFLADQTAVSESNALVFHDSESVIYSTEQTLASSPNRFVPRPGWLSATTEVDGLDDLQVSFLESEEAALNAARTVTNFQLIQLVVLIGGLLAAIWLASRLATNPLERLLAQISTIQNTRDLSLRVHEVGPREFVDLGRGFNSMLSEVQRTTVSQEEHRTSEERLAVAIQGTRDGLWDWDLETDRVWYASRYKELLGYEDNEADFPNTIESFSETLHPEDKQTTWDAVSNHREKNLEFDVEHRLKTKQGNYRWFRSRGAAIRDEAGNAIRMSGSIQDITERKGFEQALQQSNTDLEQFAYIASHDLQEPLRKVASFCGLLQQEYSDQIDDDGKKYLEFAVDGATRMRSLVQDLLMYSKIGSEKNRTRRVDSEAAMNSAIFNLDAAIMESNANITHDALPNVVAEERELSQLFQNLIGNSIKYRTAETPDIHISAVDRNENWQFSISDNGIGVKPEYRERIFGVFKRLHTRNEYSGTGIGLAICKRIIDQLNGKIWVEPCVGPGCTICFTIPKKKSVIFPQTTNVSFEGSSHEHVSVANPG